VSLVDVAPTVLAWAGVPIPHFVQGRSFADPGIVNEYVFGAGDREDENPERMKTVIDGRYQYIRNYRTDLALFRHRMWVDTFPVWQEYFQLWHEGKLTPVQRSYFETPRARDELYDLRKDPFTMQNLAADPAYETVLSRMQRAMDRWIGHTGDLSALPEKELIEKMWPGSVQPVTAAPQVRLSRRGSRLVATLSSATYGASIGYSFEGSNSDRWLLYTTPIQLDPGQRLWAKAIRYGYKESSVVSSADPAQAVDVYVSSRAGDRMAKKAQIRFKCEQI